MKTLQNIDDIEKIVRQQLILQSEVDAKFVRNSLSLHGEVLEKMLMEQVYSPISTTDVVVLFELRSRTNDSDGSETNENVTSYYKSFKVYVIIYGGNSTNIANNIVARFRTSAVRQVLYDNGIYLEAVTEPERINEYKNETMWIRNDIQIDISCQLDIKQISADYTFDSLSNVTINIRS